MCCTGPLADLDPAPYANKALALGALRTLADLTKDHQLSQPSRYTLLSLISAVIAAFDLSPYTLPSEQLDAVTKAVANLYEGQRPPICPEAPLKFTLFLTLFCLGEFMLLF